MGKAKRERTLADNEASAVIRKLRVSPQKLNLVAAAIRGLPVDEAMDYLEFSQKRIATQVRRGLKSAITNAEANHILDIDSLFVKEAYVGKDLVMKRFMPRARGRASRIQKPISNLTIIVSELEGTT